MREASFASGPSPLLPTGDFRIVNDECAGVSSELPSTLPEVALASYPKARGERVAQLLVTDGSGAASRQPPAASVRAKA